MKVVGVKVNGSNKTVYYNDNDLNLKINLTVIVNTDRGLQFGTVTEFSDDENFDKYKTIRETFTSIRFYISNEPILNDINKFDLYIQYKNNKGENVTKIFKIILLKKSSNDKAFY